MAASPLLRSPLDPGLATIPIADIAAATPAAALLLPEMPPAAHFRRDHFPAPALDPAAWELEVGGAVARPLRLDLAALQALGARSERVTLECAGHRRTELRPPVAGLQWSLGAVSEARWCGTPLARVLALAGVLPGARAVVLEGADAGSVPGRAGPVAFARALPLGKALRADTLLAWAIGPEPLPGDRGGPVRAIVPGWYATDSVKWLVRATVIDDDFDGAFETGDYRFRAPRDAGPGRRMTSVPVHALLLDAGTERARATGPALLRGIAWGGERRIGRVEVRIDDGPWREADLGPWRGPYARRFWSASWRAEAGEHQLAVRAVDGAGHIQPDRPLPNAGGYANNSVHRVRVDVP